jgi:hypothetical protein
MTKRTVGENDVTVDENGVYHSTPPKPITIDELHTLTPHHKFAELRAKMSPEAQARSAARTKEMLDEIRKERQ